MSSIYPFPLSGFVADALQIGDRFDNRNHQAQIGGRRRAGRKQAAAFLVDGHFILVNFHIPLGHFQAELTVTRQDGVYRLGQLLLDQSAHVADLGAQIFQFRVELAGYVLGKLFSFHMQ